MTFFLIISISVSYPVIYLGIVKTEAFMLWIEGKSIYELLIKAHKGEVYNDIIVIGDSVGNQLYYHADSLPGIDGFASTMAISMVGQYILLKKISANSDMKGKYVYLVYHPGSFKENLDTKFTYHYFLKPFFVESNSAYLNKEALRNIEDIPFYQYCQLPWLKATNLAPKHNVSNDNNEKVFYLSEISKAYLIKIKELAKEDGFSFRVVAPPVQRKFIDYRQERFIKQIQELDMEKEFIGYFNDMEYFDAKFFQDEVHYKDPASLGTDYLNLN